MFQRLTGALKDLVTPTRALSLSELSNLARLLDTLELNDARIQEQLSRGPVYGAGVSLVVFDNRRVEKPLACALVSDEGGYGCKLPEGYRLQATDCDGRTYECIPGDGKRSSNFRFDHLPLEGLLWLQVVGSNNQKVMPTTEPRRA